MNVQILGYGSMNKSKAYKQNRGIGRLISFRDTSRRFRVQKKVNIVSLNPGTMLIFQEIRLVMLACRDILEENSHKDNRMLLNKRNTSRCRRQRFNQNDYSPTNPGNHQLFPSVPPFTRVYPFVPHPQLFANA